MMSGYPIRSAIARTSAELDARACFGVRRPALSITFFIATLSRSGTDCAAVSPGTPSASRMRPASTTPGSHRHSTRSTSFPRIHWRTSSTVAFSSHRFRTWR